MLPGRGTVSCYAWHHSWWLRKASPLGPERQPLNNALQLRRNQLITVTQQLSVYRDSQDARRLAAQKCWSQRPQRRSELQCPVWVGPFGSSWPSCFSHGSQQAETCITRRQPWTGLDCIAFACSRLLRRWLSRSVRNGTLQSFAHLACSPVHMNTVVTREAPWA